MNRFIRKRQPKLGRIAAVTAQNFNADDFIRATRPLEQKGFAVSVVSNTSGMLTGRTESGQDVNFVPASTIGDMEFDRYCALVLPGNSHGISESAQAAIEKFMRRQAGDCHVGRCPDAGRGGQFAGRRGCGCGNLHEWQGVRRAW